jgi:hypothetical protein
MESCATPASISLGPISPAIEILIYFHETKELISWIKLVENSNLIIYIASQCAM